MKPIDKQSSDVVSAAVRALRDMSRLAPEDAKAAGVLILAVLLDAYTRDIRLPHVIAAVPQTIRSAMTSDLWSAVRGVLPKSP